MPDTGPAPVRRRGSPLRLALVVVAAALVAVLVPLGVLGIPMLLHRDAGAAGTATLAADGLSATATGADGRTRTLAIAPQDGADPRALLAGDRIVVTGRGYDAGQGIYVAICRVPGSAAEKPSPCIGGVPEQRSADAADADRIDWAPSSWINDSWAWRLFGARSWDDADAGSFTAYIEVGDPVGEGLDCTAVACAVYTRADHTATADRSQDLAVPVAFAADG
ncbi:MAG: hypothetical protein QM635_01480 [Microbacteriaceae bacterium]